MTQGSMQHVDEAVTIQFNGTAPENAQVVLLVQEYKVR